MAKKISLWKKEELCEYCGKPAPSAATKALHALSHAEQANSLFHQILRLHYGEGVMARVSEDVDKALHSEIDFRVALSKKTLEYEKKKNGKNSES